MIGEKSRRSYKLNRSWDNRLQVVVETDDSCTHVFNFVNYTDSAHSHLVYRYGKRVYDGSYNNRNAYEHDYDGYRAEWYNATTVDSFPYPFE